MGCCLQLQYNHCTLEVSEAVLTLTRWDSSAPHRGQEMLTSPLRRTYRQLMVVGD